MIGVHCTVYIQPEDDETGQEARESGVHCTVYIQPEHDETGQDTLYQQLFQVY